jgi:hypothetical protein
MEQVNVIARSCRDVDDQEVHIFVAKKKLLVKSKEK